MFKLVQYFLKETFVAFYLYQETYFVQKRIVKHNEVISTKKFEFDENEFIKFINSCFIENTQTYISTITDTFNQGVVDSCSHARYKEIGININNIRILCLDGYSVFIGMYEFNNFINENRKFKVDYVYSPYLLVDIHKKETKNSLYLLLSNDFGIVLIYEDGKKPKYSNIYQMKVEEEQEEQQQDEDNISIDDDDIDLVNDIEELDDLDDLDNLDNDEGIADDEDEEGEGLDDNDDGNIQNEILDAKKELEMLDFIKNAIKDYYEDYSEHFLENFYVLYDGAISHKFIKELENATFLDIQKEQVDVLSLMNELALKDFNV